MDIAPPPPPPPLLPYLVGATPTTTTPPQAYNNGGIAANIPQIPHHHHHTSSHSASGSSIIIVMIVISSAIIVSAAIYLLIRFLSRRRSFRTTFSPTDDDVVSNNRNGNGSNDDVVRLHHAIRVDNDDDGAESLPLFRFSSLTGKIAGGDCAVCLSRFEGVDQLRLLPLCCHAFHAECIDAWLKSNQTCPLCRSTVNPTEADVLNKIRSAASSTGGRFGGNRSNSFRIEIGNVSQRREASSDSDRRSYSIGSYEYVLDDGGGYEIPVESTHRRGGSDCTSVDKDSTAAAAPEPPGNNVAAEVGSGRRNWLRDYVDRFSVSRSSRSSSQSFRGGSGRFFGGSLRRSETVVDDYEATHGSRIGEEISELFRWFSGV